MMRAPIAAVAVLVATTLPSAAAPWQNSQLKIEGDIDVVYASQEDASGQYVLAVNCIVQSGGGTLFIVTPYPWDETASYAPEVPTTFLADGETHTLTLKFMPANNQEAVSVAFSDDPESSFKALLHAMQRAAGAIEVSYFDTSLSFSSQGSSDAIEVVKDACSLF
jgi:hypothetical protein